MVYEFLLAAVIRNHQVGGLKQQKFIGSQFWRLELQDQGSSSVGSFWRL